MQDLNQHLSDEELVLAADRELGGKTRKAQAHLGACAECRKRFARFESALADVAEAQASRFDPELPSIIGPRAMLRARLG